ncbi:MAG: TIGR03618 family F420-dependent PPOX class oxidoreductase [Actinomycetales bacterium]
MAALNLARHCLRPPGVDPQATALVVLGDDGVEVGRWTYGALERDVLGIGAGLLASGLSPGDRVFLRLGNTADTPLAFLAAMAVGLVAVPTSSMLTGEEAAVLLADCTPAAVLLADDLDLPQVEGALVLTPQELQSWRSLPAGDYADTDADDPAFIVYTSGTSATPKGVVHGHRNVLGRRAMRTAWQGLTSSDVLLHAGALSWTYTLGVGLLDPWAAGATAVVYAGSRQSQPDWWQLMRGCGATIFASVPGVYRHLLRSAPAHPPGSLRHGLVAGEALPAALWSQWRQQTGLPLYEALGMSEISTFISSGPQVPTRPGSPGRAQPGRRVAVLPLDPADPSPLPAGRVGLLAVHRDDPGLMLGYLNRPQEDAASRRGEWFVSADLVEIDADGYLHHHGRADDTMTAQGYRVSPVEVERVLQAHPDVHEVAVTQVPVRPGVEVITAFVVPEPGVGAEQDPEGLAGRLLEHCREHLARYKQPRQLRLVAELPRTANGKIRRAQLRETSANQPNSASTVLDDVMSVELPELAKKLLDAPEMAVVTTLNKDGSPQSSPVWVAREGDEVVFNTALGRAKPTNIDRDARVSVVVYPQENPYSYVEIRGTATLEDDPQAEMIHQLSNKYLGRDYPWLSEGEQRVTVRVTPAKVIVRE